MRRFSTTTNRFRSFASLRQKVVRSKQAIRTFDEIIPAVVPDKLAQQPSSSNIDIPGIDANMSRNFVRLTLLRFYQNPTIKELALENNVTEKLFERAFESFSKHCTSKFETLELPLKVLFSDIKQHGHSVDILWPAFLSHARKVFPHLDCIEQLRSVADMTQPHNWFLEARSIQRKFFFHAGPTNSGKTYNALEALKKAKSGIYCGPLRLLVNEVYYKLNQAGTPCDLITGDDRKYAFGPDEPAPHIALTVEMLPTDLQADVAVIDEIQMLRDDDRGYAWTRAVLGVFAKEVHLCGEEAAIELVNRILEPIGESPIEVRRYERINPLSISTHGLISLKNIQNGDCLVCFDKNTIFRLAKNIKAETGRECAIIFGDLPPTTKLSQAARFNNPEDPCKVLVATDAIGMGLNLNIRRIIFTTLTRSGSSLPGYMLHQIAGRAGRFGSVYDAGEVTTMNEAHLTELSERMKQPIERIQTAGIAPTPTQLEMFHYLLPHCSFVQLLEVFYSICEISGNFFLSHQENLMILAKQIDSIPLSLRDRYTFCIVPINPNKPFLLTGYLRILLTDAFDLVGAYLWLSYKPHLQDYFPHTELVRDLENSIHQIIDDSVAQIIKSTDTASPGVDKMVVLARFKEITRKMENLQYELNDLSKQMQ